MGTAERIRFFRVRAGKSTQEVAAHLGLNDSWYRDLESDDEELASTLTLFQALQLAETLGVHLNELVAERHPQETIAVVDVPSMIKKQIAR